MAQKYELSCTCGKTILVEPSQAGERLACACGKTLEVPTMRHIRQLPRAALQAPKRPQRGPWPLAYGLLFAAGLIMVAAGSTVAGYYQWGRSRLHPEETKWDDVDAAMRAIDAMPVDRAWDEWRKVRDFGIGPHVPPEFVLHRQVSRIWLYVVLGGLGVAAGGGLLMVISVLLPRPGRH